VGTRVEISGKIIGTDLSVMAVVYIRWKLPGPGHVTCPLPYDAVTLVPIIEVLAAFIGTMVNVVFATTKMRVNTASTQH